MPAKLIGGAQSILASSSAVGRNILQLARWTDEILALIVLFLLIAFLVLLLVGRLTVAELIEILRRL